LPLPTADVLRKSVNKKIVWVCLLKNSALYRRKKINIRGCHALSLSIIYNKYLCSKKEESWFMTQQISFFVMHYTIRWKTPWVCNKIGKVSLTFFNIYHNNRMVSELHENPAVPAWGRSYYAAPAPQNWYSVTKKHNKMVTFLNISRKFSHLVYSFFVLNLHIEKIHRY
jgi:hypothetical protein